MAPITQGGHHQQNGHQERLCKPTNVLNGQVAGALLRTPVGELTALPQTLQLVWCGIGELYIGISNLVNILILTMTSTVFKSCDLKSTVTMEFPNCCLLKNVGKTKFYKNSSGDEIANVNFYAVRPGSYPNSLKQGKITAITPFKVTRGHRFWYQSKAHMRLPISD